MDTAYKTTLELDKVLARAVQLCACQETKEMMQALEPAPTVEDERYDLAQTNAINALLIKNGSPRFGSVHEVRRIVAHARKGGILSMGELLEIAATLRNYVDMCATLAKMPQQKDFFAYAQKALQRTDSCYYSLIHRLLDTVDEDRICTVGVNMGFCGLIYGASELKKKADADGQPTSWITAARCGDERLAEMIPEAAKHGSYVWLLDALSTDPAQVVPLAKANPQTAFGLLADPAALTEDCVAALAACRNLVVMPLLNTPELTPEACRAARRMKAQNMFYALTVLVDDDTVDEVMQDDWLESIAQETLFCVCARKNGISDEASHRLRRSIVEGRMETGKPVLLLDWDGDVSYLNQRISEHMVFGNALPQGCSFPLQLG